ncbi:uncharacterized protein LOC135938963 [Cloeon dipterum]|uniref:uncharacterized protein LOC135938963 n=1 Tax=Cloeon dipterum TaxID=197152 RepID=UPI00321F8520
MGVIDRKGLVPKKPQEISPISDDELSIPETVSSQASTIVAQPISRPRPSNNKTTVLVLTHPGKHCGKRRLRHYKDVEDLMRWNEKNEYEITIHDFMGNKPSPFAILLNDDNLLQAWWEFINKTNQNYFIQKAASVLSLQQTSGENEENKPQKRLPMPSEYKRIERHLKEILQRKSTSPEMVREIEQLLMQFFMETPKETLRIKKLTKYESLINQAVCQYHGLDAEVDEACDKKRKDLIVALESEFYTQPTTALSNYIEQRQKFFL